MTTAKKKSSRRVSDSPDTVVELVDNDVSEDLDLDAFVDEDVDFDEEDTDEEEALGEEIAESDDDEEEEEIDDEDAIDEDEIDDWDEDDEAGDWDADDEDWDEDEEDDGGLEIVDEHSSSDEEEAIRATNHVKELQRAQTDTALEMSEEIHNIHTNGLYRLVRNDEGEYYTNFGTYMEEQIGYTGRTGLAMSSTYKYYAVTFDPEFLEDVKHVGWAKLQMLIDIMTPENKDAWLEKASEGVTKLKGYIKETKAKSPGATPSPSNTRADKRKNLSFKLEETDHETVSTILSFAAEQLEDHNDGEKVDQQDALLEVSRHYRDTHMNARNDTDYAQSRVNELAKHLKMGLIPLTEDLRTDEDARSATLAHLGKHIKREIIAIDDHTCNIEDRDSREANIGPIMKHLEDLLGVQIMVVEEKAPYHFIYNPELLDALIDVLDESIEGDGDEDDEFAREVDRLEDEDDDDDVEEFDNLDDVF